MAMWLLVDDNTLKGWEELGKEVNDKIWNEKKEQYVGRQKCM